MNAGAFGASRTDHRKVLGAAYSHRVIAAPETVRSAKGIILQSEGVFIDEDLAGTRSR